MATINFYLRDSNAKIPTLIYLVYQERGKKFKLSTGLKVEKSNWNGSRIKGKTLEIMNANKKLDEYEFQLREIEREGLEKCIKYSLETIKDKFSEYIQPKFKQETIEINAERQSYDFFDLFDQFIERSGATKKEATLYQYTITRKRLKEFEKAKRIKIELGSINQFLYDRLMSYLIRDLGLLNNTVGKHIKNFKAVLNFINQNELYEKRLNCTGFKVLKEDMDIVALSMKELMKIYNLDGLPKHLELVKDYFCFECFTGMRFSDISRMKNENYKGDHLEFKTLKTKDYLIVPLNVFAKEIIEKYKGKYEGRPIPPTLTNQKTNKYIKEIAKIAELDEIIIVEKFSGSNRIMIEKPKRDFICTHTGRRTFITLSYEKGMQPEMIMKVTGLKKWDTLKKYLKVSEALKTIKMNEFWNREKMNVV